MKKYQICLNEELSKIYETIAVLSNQPVEIILEDTLNKVIALISSYTL